MSRYRKVHCLIWNDDKFPFSSDDCQLVWFHLYTTVSTTPIGIYKAPIEGLAAEKRWPIERYRKAFEEGLAKRFWKYDARFHVVWFPRFFGYNQPENPNVLKSWIKHFDEIPNCELKNLAIQSLKAFAKGWGEPFVKVCGNLSETLPQTYPKQEQEQEQEQTRDFFSKNQPDTEPESDLPYPIPDTPKIPPAGEAPSASSKRPPPKKRTRHFSEAMFPRAVEDICQACKQILTLPSKNGGGKRFNPFQWVQSQINRRGHPEAVIEALKGLVTLWDAVEEPWAYAEKIMKTKNGNFNERDHIAQAEAFKKFSASPDIEKLLSGVGVRL